MKLSTQNVTFMKDEYTYPREVQVLYGLPLAPDAAVGNRAGEAHHDPGIRRSPGSQPTPALDLAKGEYQALSREDRAPGRQTWKRGLPSPGASEA